MRNSEGQGFKLGISCGVVFYHPGRDLSLAVHGGGFGLDSGIDGGMVRN